MYYKIPRPLDIKLETLVLSAGLLDEALMGLSLAPLLQRFLTPGLDKLLTPNLLPDSRLFWRSDEENDDTVQGIKRIIKAVTGWVMPLLTRTAKPLLQPMLKNMILNSASAAVLGLPAGEFPDAEIISQKELNIPKVFNVGEVDVTQRLATKTETELAKSLPVTPIKYDFLWNPTELAESLKNSDTWRNLNNKFDDLKDSAALKDKEKLDNIQKQCLIIDIRVRELAEKIKLFHSQYYQDEKIIEAIAKFLLHTGKQEEIIAEIKTLLNTEDGGTT